MPPRSRKPSDTILLGVNCWSRRSRIVRKRERWRRSIPARLCDLETTSNWNFLAMRCWDWSRQKNCFGGFRNSVKDSCQSGGRNKSALLVDALEAILGAIYLDAGLETVRPFILSFIVGPELEAFVSMGTAGKITDYKSALQERLQAEGRPQPAYVLVNETGPEHQKTFTIEARLVAEAAGKAEFTARAKGSTKKNAEQDAARQVLEYLSAQAQALGGGQL